jgi:elongation factor Ts
MVGTYIHPGAKVGVLVEVNCETDFVAKTADFQQLVKDVAMHIAAASPAAALYVAKDEVPADVLEKEKEIYKAQAAARASPRMWPRRSPRASSRITIRRSVSSSSRS